MTKGCLFPEEKLAKPQVLSEGSQKLAGSGTESHKGKESDYCSFHTNVTHQSKTDPEAAAELMSQF